MRILPLLLLLLLLNALALPVLAAESTEQDMLKKATNVSVTVPPTGTAAVGSVQSMSEMLDWMDSSSNALVTLIDNIMGVFGLSSTSYAKDMSQELEKAKQASNTSRKMAKI